MEIQLLLRRIFEKVPGIYRNCIFNKPEGFFAGKTVEIVIQQENSVFVVFVDINFLVYIVVNYAKRICSDEKDAFPIFYEGFVSSIDNCSFIYIKYTFMQRISFRLRFIKVWGAGYGKIVKMQFSYNFTWRYSKITRLMQFHTTSFPSGSNNFTLANHLTIQFY